MFDLVSLCISPERKITGPSVLWMLLLCSFTDALSWLWTNLLQLWSWSKSYALEKEKKKKRLAARAFATNRWRLMVKLSTWQWTCTEETFFSTTWLLALISFLLFFLLSLKMGIVPSTFFKAFWTYSPCCLSTEWALLVKTKTVGISGADPEDVMGTHERRT